MEKVQFKILTSLDEMLPNFNLIQQLTPSLTEEIYANYLERMIPHRYAQIVAMDDERVIGVSGYWLLTKLYSGPYLEIDNFIVDPLYRGKGIGATLIKMMQDEARKNNCNVMMLDAYLENLVAHAFYEGQGFKAKGYHFIKHL